ncbi:hypothetical protein D3C85_1510850 [compost metagenome]
MVGRCRRAQTGFTGIVEDAALSGKAGDVVVNDTAVDRCYTGEDAFVQGARQRWQFTLQAIQGCAVGFDIGMQVAHGVVGDLMVEAVEQDQDDVVIHGFSGLGDDRFVGKADSHRICADSVHVGAGLAGD